MKGLLQLNELEYFGSKLKAACGERTGPQQTAAHATIASTMRVDS
jgi:hypothetical protein